MRLSGYGPRTPHCNEPDPNKMPHSCPHPHAHLVSAAAIFLALMAATIMPVFAGPTPVTIAMFGDSLTAGYLLPPGHAIPDRLNEAVAASGAADVKIVNAGVSGDTTTDGLSRLDWAIGPETDGVILELGANDGLRGIDTALTRKNLEAIILTLQKRGIPVMLAGMLAPPNLGPDYGKEFNAIFPELAKKYSLLYIRFFMAGVLPDEHSRLTIDGMHPNDDGVAIVVSRLLPTVKDFIAEVRKAKTTRTASPQ